MKLVQADIKFVIATVVMLSACAYMLHLGFWQLDRLKWKEGMIATIERQKDINPQTVHLAPLAEDPANNLRRGSITGIWVPGKNMRVGPRMMNEKLGYWIVTPLVTNADHVVLVIRGWVEEAMATLMLENAPPPGIVTLNGTLRVAETGDKPVAGNGRWWHEIDPAAMAQAEHFPQADPLVIFMESSAPEDDAALIPAPVAAELRNQHRNYAIFWFVMAGILLAGFYAGAIHKRVFNLPKKN